jgi:hypothetical protein
MALEYFFDEQIRKYQLQFVRIFNSFQYMTGRDLQGNYSFRTIPATLATMDRQVNSILNNNSENVILTTPQISCWIASIRRSPERIQDPNFVRTINFWQRDIDPATQQLTSDLGQIYSVQSFMPVPYDLTMQVDIWTSNELQKQQILEQILILFNPAIDLQTGVNPIDWSALTYVELQDITWSSRSYPAGTSDTIDVASLTFRLPIWLNAPSKVKRQNIIQQIIIDIGEVEDMNIANGEGYYFSDSDLISRLVVTPGDFQIEVQGGIITLLNYDNSVVDIQGNPITWITLLQKYGKFRPGISQIHLKPPGTDIDDTSHDMIGTLSLFPSDNTKLYWTLNIQSLPANTLPAIDGIINPLEQWVGQNLDIALDGVRYLITEDIPPGLQWGGIQASQQDIIQYDISLGWRIAFDSSNNSEPAYVMNNKTGIQFHWNGSIWVNAIEGIYFPGFWRLYL